MGRALSKPHTYTADALQLVQAEYGKSRGDTRRLAAQIGVSMRALWQQIGRWRAAGHEIPPPYTVPVGTITNGYVKTELGWEIIRKGNKAQIGEIRQRADGQYEKTATGWRYLPGTDTGKYSRKRCNIKPKELPKKVVRKAAPKVAAKAKMEVQRIKTPDLSNTVPVWIPELRMTVHAAPGQDVAAVRAKYIDQRAWMKGRL